MKKLVYKGPAEAMTVPALNDLEFPRGKAVECPDKFADEKVKRSPELWEIEGSSGHKSSKKGVT